MFLHPALLSRRPSMGVMPKSLPVGENPHPANFVACMHNHMSCSKAGLLVTPHTSHSVKQIVPPGLLTRTHSLMSEGHAVAGTNPAIVRALTRSKELSGKSRGRRASITLNEALGTL